LRTERVEDARANVRAIREARIADATSRAAALSTRREALRYATRLAEARGTIFAPSLKIASPAATVARACRARVSVGPEEDVVVVDAVLEGGELDCAASPHPATRDALVNTTTTGSHAAVSRGNRATNRV
jgi:hypothetical protein